MDIGTRIDLRDILNEVLDSTTGTVTEAHIEPTDATEAEHPTESTEPTEPSEHQPERQPENRTEGTEHQNAIPTQPEASSVLVWYG